MTLPEICTKGNFDLCLTRLGLQGAPQGLELKGEGLLQVTHQSKEVLLKDPEWITSSQAMFNPRREPPCTLTFQNGFHPLQAAPLCKVSHHQVLNIQLPLLFLLFMRVSVPFLEVLK